MPGPVQLQGGNYKWSITFEGLQNELVTDESNRDLVLFDGAGGRYRFLNMSNADARYQARSPELDGLLGFEPQDRGFLVRRGPAEYRVREIKVNTDNLTITNPKGYAGNPLFSLAPEIESEHTWNGKQTFTGGIEGDLTGDTTGTHTGPVYGNLEGDTTGTHTGSVDVRGHDLFLDAGQIHFAALNADAKVWMFKRGMILLWSGAANAIPTGWFLCDGANGTPDLTDRFVIGAGGAFGPGEEGGSDSATPSLSTGPGGGHTPTGTVAGHALTIEQMPSHKHGNGVTDTSNKIFTHGSFPASSEDSMDNDGASGNREGWTSDAGGGQAHSHGLNMDAVADHTHPLTADALEILPPYYALCYIMKGE